MYWEVFNIRFIILKLCLRLYVNLFQDKTVLRITLNIYDRTIHSFNTSLNHSFIGNPDYLPAVGDPKGVP